MNFLEELQKLILAQGLYDPALVRISFTKRDREDILDMVGELVDTELVEQVLLLERESYDGG